MRGSQGISRSALPKGSSLTRPTTAPRFLDGCSMATTLAHALSSGRSDSLHDLSTPSDFAHTRQPNKHYSAYWVCNQMIKCIQVSN